MSKNKKVSLKEEGQMGLVSYCDCCGKQRQVRRANPFSDFLFCRPCEELND